MLTTFERYKPRIRSQGALAERTSYRSALSRLLLPPSDVRLERERGLVADLSPEGGCTSSAIRNVSPGVRRIYSDKNIRRRLSVGGPPVARTL